MITLTADTEKRLLRDLFLRVGASQAAADAVAQDVLEADLHGHGSHGIGRIEMQLRLAREGTIHAAADPAIQQERAASLVIDGSGAIGAHALAFAVRQAIGKARQSGACAATIFNHGYGAYYGWYAEMGLDQDCIVIAMSKSSRWNVHAFGGVQPVIGSNPVAIGIPSSGDPLLLDMSTAAAANGRLQAAARAGQAIPLGLGIDRDGQPTTDPRAVMQGATSPFGGAKGYGLGLVAEMIGGLLARAGVGPHFDDRGMTRLWSSTVIVLAVEAFMDPSEFRRQVSDYMARVKASKVAPDFEEILLPGERAYRTRRDRLRNGIPIPENTWESIASLCQQLDLAATAYLR